MQRVCFLLQVLAGQSWMIIVQRHRRSVVGNDQGAACFGLEQLFRCASYTRRGLLIGYLETANFQEAVAEMNRREG